MAIDMLWDSQIHMDFQRYHVNIHESWMSVFVQVHVDVCIWAQAHNCVHV